jgi:hypothetical protein
MARRSREPRWTISSKYGFCTECSEEIGKGDSILVVPEKKQVLCMRCGKVRAKQYGLKP